MAPKLQLYFIYYLNNSCLSVNLKRLFKIFLALCLHDATEAFSPFVFFFVNEIKVTTENE